MTGEGWISIKRACQRKKWKYGNRQHIQIPSNAPLLLFIQNGKKSSSTGRRRKSRLTQSQEFGPKTWLLPCKVNWITSDNIFTFTNSKHHSLCCIIHLLKNMSALSELSVAQVNCLLGRKSFHLVQGIWWVYRLILWLPLYTYFSLMFFPYWLTPGKGCGQMIRMK